MVDFPPPLPAEEQLRLVERAQAGDIEARNRLIETSMRLVVGPARKVWRQYPSVAVDLDDLIQEGTFGPVRAIELFDPTRGVRFATYAMPWIRQRIERYMLDHAETIRRPVHAQVLAHRGLAVEEQLAVQLRREPALGEVAEALGVPGAKLARSLPHVIYSLDVPAPASQSEGAFAEVVGDPSVDVATEAIELATLASVGPRERAIYRLAKEGWGVTTALRLKLEDIGEGRIRRDGKWVPVSPGTDQAIREWLGVRKAEDPADQRVFLLSKWTSKEALLALV